jgi:hypothetical protein
LAVPPPRPGARSGKTGGEAIRARAMAPDPCGDLVVTPKTAAKDEASCSVPTPPKVTPDEVRAVARKFADQPIQETEPDVWAVLTAISKKARLRPQVLPCPLPPLKP